MQLDIFLVCGVIGAMCKRLAIFIDWKCLLNGGECELVVSRMVRVVQRFAMCLYNSSIVYGLAEHKDFDVEHLCESLIGYATWWF